MKKTINILLLIPFFLISCGNKKSSTNFTDVYIYTSNEDYYLIENIVENHLFDFTFHTPEPQKRYNPVWKGPLDFINKPTNAQLMIISLEDPKDTTIDLIANHLLLNSDNNI